MEIIVCDAHWLSTSATVSEHAIVRNFALCPLKSREHAIAAPGNGNGRGLVQIFARLRLNGASLRWNWALLHVSAMLFVGDSHLVPGPIVFLRTIFLPQAVDPTSTSFHVTHAILVSGRCHQQRDLYSLLQAPTCNQVHALWRPKHIRLWCPASSLLVQSVPRSE